MNWAVLLQADTLALYGHGLLTTLWLLGTSLAAGGVLALLMALALTGRNAPLRWITSAYTYCIRGTQ